jgi:hypothetical protein
LTGWRGRVGFLKGFPVPLNLRRLYGQDFIIQQNPHGESRIKCHFGSIVAHGDDQLLAVCDDRRAIAKLSKSPYATVDYDEDSFAFDVEDFDQVAEIMRPVRRD